MFTEIMENLKFPLDLKEGFHCKSMLGNNSGCFFGNAEDTIWGLTQHEIIIKMENYKTDDGYTYIVGMQLGGNWYDVHGPKEKIIEELNEIIMSYFNHLAFERGMDYKK